jgi:hypothetical protein
MKHIHFVIYRLKSINIITLLLLFIYFIYFIIICIYSEIEYIKPSDDVRIQRKTIIFTRNEKYCTVFINRMINSGIVRMFIYFYNILICIFYFVRQVLCICTNNRWSFSMKNIFFYLNDFIYFLFNNLMRYWHCI